MKTLITFIALTLVQFISSQSHGYILPLDIILQKAATLAGNSIVTIEQEVQFKDGAKTYSVKETWLVEGDRNLKLTAKGLGELKDAININYLYNNKTRTSFQNKTKQSKPIGLDFFERYLAIKSKDSYMSYLKELSVGEDVRLSRAAGQTAFSIGNVSTANDVQPHVWIDQNSFRLSKIRFPSKTEVEFTNYIEKEGAHYPRLKTVTWDGKTITINVTKVSSKGGASIKSFYPESLDGSNALNFSAHGVAGATIEEFYSRFR